MSKKLQVRTPQTTPDGKSLLYDDNKQVIYTTSIVELQAKEDFKLKNSQLPTHLKHELTEIEVEDKKPITHADAQALENTRLREELAQVKEEKAVISTGAEKDKEMADLKAENEKLKAIAALKEENEALKRQLEASQAPKAAAPLEEKKK